MVERLRESTELLAEKAACMSSDIYANTCCQWTNNAYTTRELSDVQSPETTVRADVQKIPPKTQ